MATVVSRPQNTISAYEPAKYIVDSLTTASILEKMVVNVRTASSGGGTIIATLHRDWSRRTGSGPSYTYRFEVDISGILQALVGSSSSARYRAFILPAAGNIDCTDAYRTFFMEFKFLFRDPATNLLADFGDVEYVNISTTVFNVIRPAKSIFDEFWVTRYRTAVGPPLYQALYNYVTGAQIPIKLTDHYALVFNTNYCYFVRIVERLASGATHTSFLSLPSAIHSTFTKIFSVNIGPTYLLSLAASAYDANIKPQFTTNTVSYSVCCVTNVKVQITEEIQFTVLPACQSGLRLAWVNQLGGVDMYTFDAKVVEGLEGASEIGIRPNIWAAANELPTPQSRGSYKVNSQRNEYYEVETRVLRPNLAEFVSQVLTSTEVYIYDTVMSTTNPYRSAIVTDAQIITSDSDEIGMILKFKVYPANQTPTHVQ